VNFQAEQQATVLQRALFPLPFPERRLVLMALDLLAVNGALLLALALRPGYGLDGTLVLRHPFWFLLLSLLWLLIAQTFDAYDLRVAGRFSSSALAVLKAGLITVGVYLLIPYVTPPLPTSRSSLLAFPLITVGALLAGRGLYRVVLTQPALCRRTLISGAGWAGRTIAQALAGHGDGTYQVVGFVDDDPAKLGKGTIPQFRIPQSQFRNLKSPIGMVQFQPLVSEGQMLYNITRRFGHEREIYSNAGA
jgi:FlaA1/EpsC-like NDP-sugar epimerase